MDDIQDAAAVAWRVWPNNRVKLMGYGPGTDWDETPGYWTKPENLHQVIKAVTPD